MSQRLADAYPLELNEATKQIKSHLKGQATVIIALTATAFEEERAVAL